MAFTHIQGARGSDAVGGTNTLTVTLPSNPTVGNLVCLEIGFYDGSNTGRSIDSILDGNSNSYTVLDTTINDSSTGQQFQAYLLSAPSNADKVITITFNVNFIVAAVWAMEFHASNAPIELDVHDKAEDVNTVINLPSLSPTDPHELFVAGAVISNSISLPINSPWVEADGSTVFGWDAQYDTDVSSTVNPNMNMTLNSQYGACMMSFRETGTPAPPDNVGGYLLRGAPKSFYSINGQIALF